MKKLLISSSLTALLVLGGCQQLEEQAQIIRDQSQKTVSNLSQQAENVKTQIITTKAAIDEKSQQVVNAMDAVNKLTGTK